MSFSLSAVIKQAHIEEDKVGDILDDAVKEAFDGAKKGWGEAYGFLHSYDLAQLASAAAEGFIHGGAIGALEGAGKEALVTISGHLNPDGVGNTLAVNIQTRAAQAESLIEKGEDLIDKLEGKPEPDQVATGTDASGAVSSPGPEASGPVETGSAAVPADGTTGSDASPSTPLPVEPVAQPGQAI
jgi:hypothetical protein